MSVLDDVARPRRPGSPSAPPAALHQAGWVALYLAVFGLTVATAWYFWAVYPTLLYVGLDGEFVSWTSQGFGAWSGWFDLTSINPYQGMTSTFMTINPLVIPGEWARWLDLPLNVTHFLSFSIYYTEVAASTFILGRTLGLSRSLSFSGALFCGLLLFPPFHYIFGLGGWVSGAPIYAHTILLSNLILSAYFLIGAERAGAAAFPSHAVRNLGLTVAIFFLAMAGLVASPFYNAGMYCGLSVAGIAMLLTSADRRQFMWRASAAVIVACLGYVAGVLDFFLAAAAASVRFTGSSSPAQWINWPAQISAEAFAASRAKLCALGLACGTEQSYPYQIMGGLWVQFAMIAGGISLGAKTIGRGASFIALTCFFWMLILIYYILSTLDITYSPISPSYVFILLFPILALGTVFGIQYLVSGLFPDRIIRACRGHREGIALAIWSISAVLAMKATGFTDATVKAVAFSSGEWRGQTPLVDILRSQVSLKPGQDFRGYTASIIGAPGGDLRRELGLPSSSPITMPDLHRGRVLLLRTGSTHMLNDLWWWDIPTLSEYGQGISPQLRRFGELFLGSDPSTLNYFLIGDSNIDLLMVLGTRFVIADKDIDSTSAKLVSTLAFGESGHLRLYELAHPNLGSLSLERLLPIDSTTAADDFVSVVRDAPEALRSQAYVEPRYTGDYSPAESARLSFERGGIRVRARSKGTSAVLVPVQFSNCYTIDDPNATFVRANLIQSALIFETDVDARLSWDFGFMESACKRRDAREVEALLQRISGGGSTAASASVAPPRGDRPRYGEGSHASAVQAIGKARGASLTYLDARLVAEGRASRAAIPRVRRTD